MNHHRVWRLRKLQRVLKQLIREARQNAEPDARIIQELRRRKPRVNEDGAIAEARHAPAAVRMDRG